MNELNNENELPEVTDNVEATESAAPVAESAPKKEKAPRPTTPPADFDWNAIGKRQEVYSKAQREDFETMYNATLNVFAPNDVLDGKIIGKTKKEFIVTIGGKSEGTIALSEVRYNPDYAIGDAIEVYVERVEDGSGQLVLSHRKARALRSWDKVNAALENDDIITGQIKCRTKGGLIADVFGIEAFLPGSQIDNKRIKSLDEYIGKSYELKILKINLERKNIVVSRREILEDERVCKKTELLENITVGDR